jgi:hypothetical protein
MPTDVTFTRRLRREIIPTPLQAIGALILASVVLIASQSQALLARFGITQAGIDVARQQFATHMDFILSSPLAANLALITFWATIGLMAYLICWGAYNLYVEARNQVTVETGYTNHGHWRSAWETLALKAVCAAALVACLAVFKYGLSFWLALAAAVFTDPSVMAILQALGAVLGLAVQLYLVLVLIQLTFTPWYNTKAFTE